MIFGIIAIQDLVPSFVAFCELHVCLVLNLAILDGTLPSGELNVQLSLVLSADLLRAHSILLPVS